MKGLKKLGVVDLKNLQYKCMMCNIFYFYVYYAQANLLSRSRIPLIQMGSIIRLSILKCLYPLPYRLCSNAPRIS